MPLLPNEITDFNMFSTKTQLQFYAMNREERNQKLEESIVRGKNHLKQGLSNKEEKETKAYIDSLTRLRDMDPKKWDELPQAMVDGKLKQPEFHGYTTPDDRLAQVQDHYNTATANMDNKRPLPTKVDLTSGIKNTVPPNIKKELAKLQITEKEWLKAQEYDANGGTAAREDLMNARIASTQAIVKADMKKPFYKRDYSLKTNQARMENISQTGRRLRDQVYTEREKIENKQQQQAAAAARQLADANAANTNNSTPKRGNSGPSVTTLSRYAVASPPKLPPTTTDFSKKLLKLGVIATVVAVGTIALPPVGGMVLKGVAVAGKSIANAVINVKANGSVSCSADFIKSLKTDAQRDDFAKTMIAAHKATRRDGDKSPIAIRCKDPLMMAAMQRQLTAQGYPIAPSQQALQAQQKRLQQQQAANMARNQNQEQEQAAPRYKR